MIDLRTPTAKQRRRQTTYDLEREKRNAQICLYEYHQSRKAFYLWGAIAHTQNALGLVRVLASLGVAMA